MSLTDEKVGGDSVLRAHNLQEWRDWLEENSRTHDPVWLITYNKGSNVPSVTFHEALEHALCFGWVDSKAIKRDVSSCYLKFSRRNPKSSWGRRNRERVEKLSAQGYMTPSGQEVIDEAKRNGLWEAHADAQNLVVPPDLERSFKEQPEAWRNFEAFPASSKRLILEWISNAKRDETRSRRVLETVRLAKLGVRANHPQSRQR